MKLSRCWSQCLRRRKNGFLTRVAHFIHVHRGTCSWTKEVGGDMITLGDDTRYSVMSVGTNKTREMKGGGLLLKEVRHVP